MGVEEANIHRLFRLSAHIVLVIETQSLLKNC